MINKSNLVKTLLATCFVAPTHFFVVTEVSAAQAVVTEVSVVQENPLKAETLRVDPLSKEDDNKRVLVTFSLQPAFEKIRDLANICDDLPNNELLMDTDRPLSEIDKNTLSYELATQYRKEIDSISTSRTSACTMTFHQANKDLGEIRDRIIESTNSHLGSIKNSQRASLQKSLSDEINEFNSRFAEKIQEHNRIDNSRQSVMSSIFNEISRMAEEAIEKKRAFELEKNKLEQLEAEAIVDQEKLKAMVALIKNGEAFLVKKFLGNSDYSLTKILKSISQQASQSVPEMIKHALNLIMYNDALDELLNIIAAELLPFWQDQQNSWLTFELLSATKHFLSIADAVVIALVAIIQADLGDNTILLKNPNKPCGYIGFKYHAATSSFSIIPQFSESVEVTKLLFFEKEFDGKPDYVYREKYLHEPDTACIPTKVAQPENTIYRIQLMALLDEQEPGPVAFFGKDICCGSVNKVACKLAEQWNRTQGSLRPASLARIIQTLGILTPQEIEGKASEFIVQHSCEALKDQNSLASDRLFMIESQYSQSPTVLKFIEESKKLLLEQCSIQPQQPPNFIRRYIFNLF